MFEIWQLDRNGAKHKMLASTPFTDMAEICARAITERLWSLDGTFQDRMANDGDSWIAIHNTETGLNESRIVARKSERLTWKVEECKQ